LEKIGFVKGNGNSNSPKNYSYTDEGVTSGKYNYRLKQIDNDGQFEYSKVVEVSIKVPEKFALEQNYPNPFNPGTKINFVIPKSSFVNLKVYDVLGNEVATLVEEEKQAGSYEVNFDASQLSSGVYFCKLTAGDFIETKKMLLMK
jgi:Secretion system C-terminal sorting domain